MKIGFRNRRSGRITGFCEKVINVKADMAAFLMSVTKRNTFFV
jgi:hypothetical protein